jgi:hypothetical protein
MRAGHAYVGKKWPASSDRRHHRAKPVHAGIAVGIVDQCARAAKLCEIFRPPALARDEKTAILGPDAAGEIIDRRRDKNHVRMQEADIGISAGLAEDQLRNPCRSAPRVRTAGAGHPAAASRVEIARHSASLAAAIQGKSYMPKVATRSAGLDGASLTRPCADAARYRAGAGNSA